MITFKKTLCKTRYPGYYWCAEEKKLYSIKVDGKLKPLKRYDVRKLPNMYLVKGLRKACSYSPYYYQVSVEGRRRYLLYVELVKLQPDDYEIPVEN